MEEDRAGKGDCIITTSTMILKRVDKMDISESRRL